MNIFSIIGHYDDMLYDCYMWMWRILNEKCAQRNRASSEGMQTCKHGNWLSEIEGKIIPFKKIVEHRAKVEMMKIKIIEKLSEKMLWTRIAEAVGYLHADVLIETACSIFVQIVFFIHKNRKIDWFSCVLSFHSFQTEFWEDHFSCRYPNSSLTPYNKKYKKMCTTKEQLTKNTTAFEDQLQFVSDAVMAFAYALR